MTDQEIPYLKIRAVRDETGASHDECRRALQDSGGDVAGAVSLWFARRRGNGSASSGVGREQLGHTEPIVRKGEGDA
ncbi:MAG: hypothetical protein ACLP50_03885 [Solirubrobacteraceae bacterium]